MKRVSMTTAGLVLAAIGFTTGCAAATANAALNGGEKALADLHGDVPPDSHALPDIGAKMPDGRIYGGLSMDTGKPMYLTPAGGKKPDGTVYAGFSPDKNHDLYTTPADAPDVYTWAEADEYCKTLSASGHRDWRIPSLIELGVEFNNRADIGGFNETGRVQNALGFYWSSLQVGEENAWARRFNDGLHENISKDDHLLLRCVR